MIVTSPITFEIFEQVSVAAITVWIISRIFNALCSRLVGDRIVDTYISRIKKKWKAYRTKFKGIKADLEFTAYLNQGTTVTEGRDAVETLFNHLSALSEGDAKTIRFNWETNTKGRAKIEYIDNSPFEISVNLVRDSASIAENETQLSSVGISIQFEFPFQDLKGTLLDIGNFVGFLQTLLENKMNVDRFTQNQIVISSVENNLTLDDWIKEQQFEVSLLLTSGENRRSVEFFEDRAIITSPSSGIDDKTAEYIRLTLLNYYL